MRPGISNRRSGKFTATMYFLQAPPEDLVQPGSPRPGRGSTRRRRLILRHSRSGSNGLLENVAPLTHRYLDLPAFAVLSHIELEVYRPIGTLRPLFVFPDPTYSHPSDSERGTELDRSDPGDGMRAKEATNRGRSTVLPRATRYDIVTTLWYRVRGETTWREGLLKNFSISGTLIAVKQPLEVGTNIEMKFTLPIELKGSCAADVFCRGYVVRSTKEFSTDTFVNIAARLSYSHLMRQADIS